MKISTSELQARIAAVVDQEVAKRERNRSRLQTLATLRTKYLKAVSTSLPSPRRPAPSRQPLRTFDKKRVEVAKAADESERVALDDDYGGANFTQFYSGRAS